jgi:hypothetical protein
MICEMCLMIYEMWIPLRQLLNTTASLLHRPFHFHSHESPRTSAMLCSHGPSMVQFHQAMGGMPTGATRRASGGSSISDKHKPDKAR